MSPADNAHLIGLEEENRRLREALTECQSTLAMFIEPKCFETSSVVNAWAAAVAAEARARAALREGAKP